MILYTTLYYLPTGNNIDILVKQQQDIINLLTAFVQQPGQQQLPLFAQPSPAQQPASLPACSCHFTYNTAATSITCPAPITSPAEQQVSLSTQSSVPSPIQQPVILPVQQPIPLSVQQHTPLSATQPAISHLQQPTSLLSQQPTILPVEQPTSYSHNRNPPASTTTDIFSEWDTSTDDDADLSWLSLGSSNSYIDPAPSIPLPTFSTPPKLLPVEQVMRNRPGTDVQALRELAISLARDAIFGKDELIRCSLSGRKNTGILDKEKLDYIKTAIRSRIPNKSAVEFEFIWSLCRSSISKSCQGLRNNARKRL